MKNGVLTDSTAVWQFRDFCGFEYEDPVEDSSEFLQPIEFKGIPIMIEVRSGKDPHMLFGKLTRGLYELDNSPGGQIAAGVILLMFAVSMLLMSLYKTYRFLIKYTFPRYNRSKR